MTQKADISRQINIDIDERKQKLIVHKVSSDDAQLGNFIRRCVYREEMLYQQIAALSDQIERRNSSIQYLSQQQQQIQLALNDANINIRNLELAFGQFENLRTNLQNQIHREEQNHKITQKFLRLKIARYDKMEMNEKWCWFSLEILLSFLSGIQTTLVDEKGIALAKLLNGNTLEALIEGRNRLAKFKKTIDYELESNQTVYEKSVSEISSKNEVKAEAEDNERERYAVDYEMKDIKKTVLMKRRAKAERKGSRAHLARKGLWARMG